MKNLFLILMMFFVFTISAQTIKQTTIDYMNGKITYNYFEDSETFEHIKHGAWKYVESDKNDIGTFSKTITGNFKNGYRDGTWNFNTTSKDYGRGSYMTGTTTFIQTYKDGYPNGVWKYDSNMKMRNLYYDGNGRAYWSSFTAPQVEYIHTSFNMGSISGITKFKYHNNSNETIVNINNDGFLVGSHKFNKGYYIFELESNNGGFVTKFIQREKNGNVYSNNSPDSDMLSLYDDYKNNRLSVEDLNNNGINISTKPANYFVDIADVFEKSEYLLFTIAGGDKSLISQSKTNRKYGKYLILEKIDFIDLNNHHPFAIIKSRDMSEGKINAYKQYIEIYAQQLKQEDIEFINNKIKSVENELKTHHQNVQDKYQYDSVLEIFNQKIVNHYRRNPNGKVSSVIYSAIDNHLKEEKRIGNEILNNVEYHTYYKTYKSPPNDDYKPLLEKLNQNLDLYRNYYGSLYNNINDIIKLGTNTDISINETIKNFNNTTNTGSMNVYQNQSNPVDNLISGIGSRKTIFDVYNELVDELIISINSNMEFEELTHICESIILIGEKTISLKESNNRDRLREIRREKSLDNKIKIFLE